jgi:uncharacterized protein (TIGR03382 family)
VGSDFIRRGARLAFAAALGVLASGAASADPIGPECGTCQGSIYTLEYDPTPLATTPTTKTYRITLEIDSSGYTGGGVGIDTVSVKVANLLLGAWLTDAPSGVGNWLEFTNQGLNAAGCSSSGGGFSCARVVTDGAVPAVGGTLFWEWNIVIASSIDLLTDPFEASVKARYVDELRQKVGALVSEDISLQPTGIPVPEPATATLAASGLAVLGALSRRRRR